jgi:hypothetical protein
LTECLTHDGSIAAASLLSYVLLAIFGCAVLYDTAQGFLQSGKDSAKSSAEAKYANDIAFTSALSESARRAKRMKRWLHHQSTETSLAKMHCQHHLHIGLLSARAMARCIGS